MGNQQSTATADQIVPSSHVPHVRVDRRPRKRPGTPRAPMWTPTSIHAARFKAVVRMEDLAREAEVSLTAASFAERGMGRPEHVKALKAALKRIVARRRS